MLNKEVCQNCLRDGRTGGSGEGWSLLDEEDWNDGIVVCDPKSLDFTLVRDLPPDWGVITLRNMW